MIALVRPPVAEPTITLSAVAMNSALPTPQPILKLRVAGGYQNISFAGDTDTINGIVYADQPNLGTYYVNALVAHRINAAITQNLAVGREGLETALLERRRAVEAVVPSVVWAVQD